MCVRVSMENEKRREEKRRSDDFLCFGRAKHRQKNTRDENQANVRLNRLEKKKTKQTDRVKSEERHCIGRCISMLMFLIQWSFPCVREKRRKKNERQRKKRKKKVEGSTFFLRIYRCVYIYIHTSKVLLQFSSFLIYSALPIAQFRRVTFLLESFEEIQNS